MVRAYLTRDAIMGRSTKAILLFSFHLYVGVCAALKQSLRSDPNPKRLIPDLSSLILHHDYRLNRSAGT